VEWGRGPWRLSLHFPQGPPSYSSRDKVTKRRGKERVEWGRGPWRAVLAFSPGAPEFQFQGQSYKEEEK